MSWRYRYAWMSARRRANNAAGSVAYWKQTTHHLEAACKKLATELAEAKQRRVVSMGDLVPAPPAVDAIGSHDRRNALRLADENERLRDALQAAQLRAVVLAKQLKEGNPS